MIHTSATSGRWRVGFFWMAVVLMLLPPWGRSAEPAPTTRPTTQPLPQSPAELYQMTTVWTVHLKFSPDQWAAMEPRQTGRATFGTPPPEAFGPASPVAAALLKHGDADGDSKLSKDEQRALAARWFTEWDKPGAGRLEMDQLRDGLNATIPAPPPQPPPFILRGPEGRRNGLTSAFGLEFNYVKADLEFQDHLIRDIGVRYKGNGTWMESNGSFKRSLKLDLNRHVKGQNLAGVTTINLHNCVTDASWMNEVLSHRLFRDAGVPAPRTAYARVVVSVPGKYDRKYFGLYSMVENIDATFAREVFAVKGGAILKPVTPAPFTDLGADWDAYNQTYDPKTGLSKAERQRIIDFCRLVSHAPDEEFAARLPEFLDLDNFSRFMAIEVYLSTLDSILSIGQNYYVYLHPRTNKLHFMPWDLDHSFGQFPMIGSQEQREQLSIDRPWRGEIRFLERVFKVEAFAKLYRERLREFSKTLFRPERFAEQVDAIAAAIRPAAEAESPAKLRRLNRVAAGQSPDGPGMLDAVFGRGRGRMVQSPKPIKAFVGPRTQSVIEQLAGASKGYILPDTGFGAPPRPGPGGPPGPGNFLGPIFMMALDADRNGQLSREEFVGGLERWFESWTAGAGGPLSEQQLRDGLNRTFAPPRPGQGSGPGMPPPAGPLPRLR